MDSVNNINSLPESYYDPTNPDSPYYVPPPKVEQTASVETKDATKNSSSQNNLEVNSADNSAAVEANSRRARRHIRHRI